MIETGLAYLVWLGVLWIAVMFISSIVALVFRIIDWRRGEAE